MNLPPLAQLIVRIAKNRRLLANKFTISVIVLSLAIGAGSYYVGANSDGRLSGQVITETGEPVNNVTVVLTRIDVRGGVTENFETTTNDQGEFLFANQTKTFEFEITVKDGETALSESLYHLYFPGQNKHVTITVTNAPE